MALRTNISTRYLIRLTIVGLFCIGFGLYCLYDGMVAWPDQRKRALAYQELKNQGREEDWAKYSAEHGWKPFDKEEPRRIYEELKEQGRLEDLRQELRGHGWEVYKPRPEEPRSEAAIQGQFFMLALAGGAGVLVLLNVLRSIGRWIEMDNKGLRSSRGQELAFDQVTQIDKKKWDKKGIAKLLYEANGRQSVFTLDDFIFERPTTDEILRKVEDRVGHDKIVNGKPEPPPQAKEAAAESAS